MENTNDKPVEIDSYDFREWHLLEEKKPTKNCEYLVTVSTDYYERKEYRHVDIWWWTGNDFCKPDCMGIPEAHVIAWTEMPTPCMGDVTP